MKVVEAIAGKLTGRPQMPSQGEREGISARWLNLGKEIPDLHVCYLKLPGERPEVTIGSLHRVILQDERAVS